jgi:hypothetical protein
MLPVIFRIKWPRVFNAIWLILGPLPIQRVRRSVRMPEVASCSRLATMNFAMSLQSLVHQMTLMTTVYTTNRAAPIYRPSLC